VQTKTLKQTITFKASPRQVYDMIMDSKKHQLLSGEKAEISQRVGGKFTAWGSHLSGINLVLKPGKKIVQAWRATGWWPDHRSRSTRRPHRRRHRRRRALTTQNMAARGGPAVPVVQPTSRPIARLAMPSAASSTIRARWRIRYCVLVDRAKLKSSARSSGHTAPWLMGLTA
jgi:uncharacterized protein YndB with AHSA1/START domain